MTRRIATFRIDDELLAGLREVFERDGVSVPEQVRRAIRQWLEQRGIRIDADRNRPVRRVRGPTATPNKPANRGTS